MYRSMIINRMIMIDSGCDKNVKSIMVLFYRVCLFLKFLYDSQNNKADSPANTTMKIHKVRSNPQDE